MNYVATTLAPALVVGLATLLLVGPVAGALGAACGFLLGWSVSVTARDAEAATDSSRSGPAPEFRDARVE